MNSIVQVKSAVYGALDEKNPARILDVVHNLQKQIDASQGIVAINNTTMGGDPAYGTGKLFRATVTIDGTDHAFACREGESVDFRPHGQAGLGQMLQNVKSILG